MIGCICQDKVKSVEGKVKELTVLVSGGAHSPKPVIVVDEGIGRELGLVLENFMK